MVQTAQQGGIGIGAPSTNTRPNGLAVVANDAVTVVFIGPSGIPIRAALPRLVIGPFTFSLNPAQPLTVSEPAVLATHRPPGGSPRYQWMGRDEIRLTLRGTLAGATALDNLAALRAINGTRQPFSYGSLSAAQCWVRLDWTMDRDDQVDYAIALLIEADLALSTGSGAATSAPAQAEGQAPTNSPPGQAPPTVSYTVVEGDTLFEIARRRYGNGSLWPVIARLNAIDDPRTLQVGSVLQLPSDRAAANALKAQQDTVIAGYPSDTGVGIPAAAGGSTGLG